RKALPPSARDAFAVFEDLCLLANSEKPRFLQLDYLHKTFALELIESVLTNYHALFRQHPELTLLLRHHLCPLLIKALSDRPQFALTLRCTRVVFLLLKQFHAELQTEAEVFLVMLIKIITEDTESEPAEHPPRPHWMRVMRGLCSDAGLVFSALPSFAGPPAHGLPVKGPVRGGRGGCYLRGSMTSSSMTPPSSGKITTSKGGDEREGGRDRDEPAPAAEQG
ncbi:guanine nucleotide exchange factor in Golgi transport N-terminal-domain-containing protein, partial [Schizophyllum commune]